MALSAKRFAVSAQSCPKSEAVNIALPQGSFPCSLPLLVAWGPPFTPLPSDSGRTAVQGRQQAGYLPAFPASR